MLSPKKASYALILKVNQDFTGAIGRLGTFPIKSGYYIYVGSAFGSGGLLARITHHKRIAAKPHWHIDYLRQGASLIGLWYSYDEIKREHDWANILTAMDGVTAPYPGFGSSDCTCETHLSYHAKKPSHQKFTKQISAHFSDHGQIYKKDLVVIKTIA